MTLFPPMPHPARARIRFAAVIAFALLLKALVPTGWMPAFEDGRITLRLCGGWMPATAINAQGHHGMTMDPAASPPTADHDRHGEEQQGSDQPCSFAAAGLSWTAPGPSPTADLPLPLAALRVTLSPAVSIGRGLAAPPPPSTGPPLLS